MAGDKIRQEDIYDKNILDALIIGADNLINKLNQITVIEKESLLVKKEILQVVKVSNSESLSSQANLVKQAEKSLAVLEKTKTEIIQVKQAKEALTAATKKAEVSEKELANTRIADIKLMRAREKSIDDYNKKLEKETAATKKAALEQFKINSEYEKTKKKYNELSLALINLNLKGRENGKTYKGIKQEVDRLGASLTKAENAAGKFQRNVGNYPKALSGIGNQLAAVFSVGAVVNFGQKILETRAEFQKFEAVLTNTLGSGAAAEQVLNRIQTIAAKTPFSVKELTESFVKLANQGFEPTNAELIKLGDLAASQGKSFDQLTEGIIDAQTGEFERLKEFGIRASKEGDKVKFTFKGVQTQTDFNSESIRKYVLSLGELEGVSGGMAAISDTLGGKISNLGDNFDTFFNNLGKDTQGVFSVFLDSFNTLLGQANEAQAIFSKINNELAKGGGEITLFEKLTSGNGQLFELQKILNGIASSGKNSVDIIKDLEIAVSVVNKQYKEGSISAIEYKNSSILLSAAIADQREIIKAGLKPKGDDLALTEAQIKAAKELAKANKDLNNQLESLRIETTQLDQKRDEAKAKNDFRLASEALAESKGSASTKAKIQAELEIKLQQQLAEIQDKYAKEARDKKNKEAEDLKAKEEKEESDFIAKIEKDNADLKTITDERNAAIRKELDDRKARRQQEYEDAVKTSEQILDIFSKEIEKKSALREKAIDDEISKAEKVVDIQRQLAEKGQKNTLAAEEANKAKLEQQKEAEKKKEIQRQEVLAFFKLFASYAEKDPNGALQKALRDTLLAKAIAGGLDGNFIEGTENVARDLKGNKFKDGEDGYAIAVDGRERILSPEQNALVGDMSNEALAKLAHDAQNGKLMALSVAPSNDFNKNIVDSAALQQMALQHTIINELREIKNKPVHQSDFSKLGEFIETTIVNGNKEIRRHKINTRLG